MVLCKIGKYYNQLKFFMSSFKSSGVYSYFWIQIASPEITREGV